MLGEFFLDQCFTACCSMEHVSQKSKEIFFSIYHILKWYTKEVPKDKKSNFISEASNEKLDFLLLLSRYRHENNTRFVLEHFNETLQGGKFEEFIPFLLSKRRILTEEDEEDIFKFLLEKRKLCDLLQDKNNFTLLLNDIEVGNYSNDSELVNRWEKQMSSSYTNLMDVKRIESISTASSLNLKEDNYDDIFVRFKEAFNVKESFKTGYKTLSNALPCKGFERRRLYVIGGETGVGKSAMLINFICNSIKNETVLDEEETYLYITAENLIDESLIRFYCCLTGESQFDVVEKLEKEPDFDKYIKTSIVDILNKSKKNIQFYYVQPRKTTLREIEALIDNTARSSKNLKAVFLDYLDLIRSGTDTLELHRELGEVTLGLKSLAVSYNVVLVTATQLNRSGYDVESSANITQIGKSIEKAEDSDFILFLQNTKDGHISFKTPSGIKTIKVIRMTILKNRNGSTGQEKKLMMLKSIDDKDSFNYQINELMNIDESSIIHMSESKKDKKENETEDGDSSYRF